MSKEILNQVSDLGDIGSAGAGDYFPCDDLKVNLGIDGIQMLDDPNIIPDPSVEDSFHLDTL